MFDVVGPEVVDGVTTVTLSATLPRSSGTYHPDVRRCAPDSPSSSCEHALRVR